MRSLIPFTTVAIAAAILVTLTGCTTPSPPPPLRIGAWNIEWLGTPDRRFGDAAGVAQRPGDLADVIEHAGVSIVALQEIRATARPHTGWTNATLTSALAQLSERTGGHWRHRLFPDRRDGTQVTGIAWDAARVTPIGAPRVLDVSHAPGPLDRPLWSRPPWAMKFRLGAGRTDLVVIPVHMKSNWGGDYAEHRRAEAQDLIDALPAIRRHFRDDDILVIGDTNCGAAGEPALAVFASAGFDDRNAANRLTHITGGAADRAFVPRDQPEFAPRTFDVYLDDYAAVRGWSREVLRRACSDHALIAIEVRVMRDDD